MDLYTTDKIYSFGLEPENEIDFEHWTSQKGVVDYLEHEAKDEYIIIYASLPHTFIYSVFIPNVEINEKAIEDLKEWDCDPYSLWGVGDSSRIEHSLSGSRSEILNAGEQIVFGRSFKVINNDKSYYELNQKLVHALGIHYVEENDAWCKLDKHGDVVDVFKVLKINDRYPGNQTRIIIYAKREELSKYVNIEDLTLIRMFDFTRYKSDEFVSWDNNCESKEFGNSTSVYGSLSITPGIGSYSRGFQLVDLSVPKEQSGGIFSDKEYKKYCSYIARDWRSNTIKKISCHPDCWVNQFTESNLPYDITPAFFNPEVLLKYKSDREKYKLGDRSISCRDTWHLETFDVNAAGQVHTYLVYLSKLPYEEQLHWKQYNEEPKALLSERAFITDIKGEWDEIYDPLLSLKQKLRNLSGEGAPWWTLRDKDALDKVQYVYTKSKDEWDDEILNLDQLLIEGLNKKWLSKRAEDLDCEFKEDDGTLNLLEVVLVTLDFEEKHAKKIMEPFRVVHKLRSIKAHTSGTKAEIARKNALKEHGSFKKHFEKICVDCDKSVGIITEEFKRSS
ncbi:MAG: hypothetical protein ACNYPH_02565 [Gammaproteobacteria bacterium WSBS_2016_MAG_OTU1]